MSVYKPKGSKYYHYDFLFKGIKRRGTTHQTNINKARLVEAKVKSDLAMAEHGLAPKETKEIPLFEDFIEGAFIDHVKQEQAGQPGTLSFYTYTAKRLLDCPEFKNKTVDEIDAKAIEKYKQWRQGAKKRRGTGPIRITTINAEIRVLRKAMLWAYSQGHLEKRPDIDVIPGEEGRDFVLSPELERTYIAVLPEPLRSAVVFMLDWGLRPIECVRLRKCDVTEDGVNIPRSKTKSGIRALPHTARTRDAWLLLMALFPNSEWLFPGRDKGTHYKRTSLNKWHASILAKQTFPKELTPYALRHTFGTNLAESDAQPFEIKELMGHSSITVSQKYIHPRASRLTLAMKRKEELDRIHREGSPKFLAAAETEIPEVVTAE